jgi:hypothetical protein
MKTLLISTKFLVHRKILGICELAKKFTIIYHNDNYYQHYNYNYRMSWLSFNTTTDNALLANILNQQILLNIATNGQYGTNDVAITMPLIYSREDFKKPLLFKTDDSLYVIQGTYPFLNSDDTFINKVIRWVRYKMVNDWLYDEMRPLLSYFDVTEDGKVHWQTKDKFRESAYIGDSVDVMRKKIEYIEEEVLSKKLIKHVLEKFIDYNNLNWYDIKANKNKVARVFNAYLNRKFEDRLR